MNTTKLENAGFVVFFYFYIFASVRFSNIVPDWTKEIFSENYFPFI